MHSPFPLHLPPLLHSPLPSRGPLEETGCLQHCVSTPLISQTLIIEEYKNYYLRNKKHTLSISDHQVIVCGSYAMQNGGDFMLVSLRSSYIAEKFVWFGVLLECPILVALTHCIFTTANNDWSQVFHLGLVSKQKYDPFLTMFVLGWRLSSLFLSQRDYNSLWVLVSWCLLHAMVLGILWYRSSASPWKGASDENIWGGNSPHVLTAGSNKVFPSESRTSQQVSVSSVSFLRTL